MSGYWVRNAGFALLATVVAVPSGFAEGPTYAKEVSRLMQENCQQCHRPTSVAPFSLMNYRETKARAKMIKEVVTSKRMPPWFADPAHGKFSNDRRLTDDQINTLVAWIDGGAPLGDEKDMPEPKQFVDGWQIGQPDVIFELPIEIDVQATGVVDYQNYQVETNFDQDMYVQAAEALPGNTKVVHHIIVTAIDPANPRDRANREHVAGMAPGAEPVWFEPGTAGIIPKGSVLNFQMHYTPTGKAEKDRSKIGIVFAKEKPKYISKTQGAFNTKFAIPAGNDNHEVLSSWTFDENARLLTLMPHMHYRGKDFKYTAVFPDGREQVLLAVPRYDFNWQLTYRLDEPLLLPAGSRIDCVAHFDNSDKNAANPDPKSEVKWGDQTWEEMMIGWFRYTALPDGETDLLKHDAQDSD